jgi:hypothetical protein
MLAANNLNTMVTAQFALQPTAVVDADSEGLVTHFWLPSLEGRLVAQGRAD